VKRILLVFSLMVCLLVAGQTVCFADTVSIESADDPGFSGGSIAVPFADSNWASSPDFNSAADTPLALSADESAAISARQTELAQALRVSAQSSTSLYSVLDETNDADWDQSTLESLATPSVIPATMWYCAVKLPCYDQKRTPYCGPFSTYQILRYMGSSEPDLMKHLISEMYIPGQGSSIYRLARSLNKRLYFTYMVSDVGSATDYAYKHVVDIRNHKMPLDNLVRIQGGKFGHYQHYHAGHFLDSNGYYFDSARRFGYILATDTYNERNESGGHTLGPHWIPFWQMHRGVVLHPRHKVVW